MTAIQSSSLVKVYHKSKTPALRKVSLTVNRGQIFTLLGRNGAGKTTFLRIAATQLLPTDGKVEVLGSNVVSEAAKIRKQVAVVPQEGNTIGPLTQWDHVNLTLLAGGLTRATPRDRTRKVQDQQEMKPN